MRKLIFILLAFLAIFTYIRAFDTAEAGEIHAGEIHAGEIPAEIHVEIAR